MLWGLILMSGILFLPESPRHLLYTNREAEARVVIAELNSAALDDEIVEESISELMIAISAENEGGEPTWIECFSTRNSLWKRTINGMMLQFIQQLNGQNFYCTCRRLLVYYLLTVTQTTTATRSSRVLVPR
jgi:SP family sugar:H+ symporter-like MFS transporter